jgi:hypothetical protein
MGGRRPVNTRTTAFFCMYDGTSCYVLSCVLNASVGDKGKQTIAAITGDYDLAHLHTEKAGYTR